MKANNNMNNLAQEVKGMRNDMNSQLGELNKHEEKQSRVGHMYREKIKKVGHMRRENFNE